MSDQDCFLRATELAQRIRRKELSVREPMQAPLAQGERLKPRLNAIVSWCAEQALAQATQSRRGRAAIAAGK